uniref:Uncharacterized protein n=1 Tax=Triticum urartu TaxID=4572 RepID=A0A8R7UR85_TRIUA
MKKGHIYKNRALFSTSGTIYLRESCLDANINIISTSHLAESHSYSFLRLYRHKPACCPSRKQQR